MSHNLPATIRQILMEGTVIPATPTALTPDLKLDEKHQRGLIRYYLEAGAGGLAAGVHTSQFEIREAGLYRPLLELVAEEIEAFEKQHHKPIIKIAGAIGNTRQAVSEAIIAAESGYHAVLLSLAAWQNASNEDLIKHCREVARIIPLVGFYLQPDVGGRLLDTSFWRQFARIENVIAIKIAPFNRYHTLEVVRGVAESGRAEEIALYTGNDDNIVADLLTEYHLPVGNQVIAKKIVGGLLGHWAVWTRRVVELFGKIKNARPAEYPRLLTLGTRITDANAAFFDVRNNFAGSIAGIHAVLIRQGLLPGHYTINPKERLSPGQQAEIDRVYAIYPELNDDHFVAANLKKWHS